jgi:hypothetical protein
MIMCTYGEDRGDILIGYLYGDLDPGERVRFEAHLASCSACAGELAELGGVRAQLGRWSPPEPGALVHPGIEQPRRWWRDVPAWAQAAAALLVLGASAAIMHLEVRFDGAGVTVRTGWSAAASPLVQGDRADVPAPVAIAGPASDAWRAELAAVEARLRREFRLPAATITTAARPEAQDDPALLRRVRAIVEESERRQQRELALRIAGVMRDVDAQRQADLVRIDRSLGTIERNTGVEVMRQGQMLNYLVRTAQAR